jgi:ABC-type transport system involved in cytochrome c biogenesis ATPase subunit
MRMSAINVHGLSKRFGDVLAVDGLGFEVEEGTVVGFLGPNGAGKTTTLRMLLGLVTPTAGSATFGGRAYRELPAPTRAVGAVLEASGFHPGRSARNHLRVLATAAGLPWRRVDEVLGQVGLAEAANRRVGGFSLGMRQHLGLAAALLGDLTAGAATAVRVRTPQAEALRDRLAAAGAAVQLDGPDQLVVTGVTSEQVGRAAAAAGIVLHEMRFERSNLEEVFLELTNHGGKQP